MNGTTQNQPAPNYRRSIHSGLPSGSSGKNKREMNKANNTNNTNNTNITNITNITIMINNYHYYYNIILLFSLSLFFFFLIYQVEWDSWHSWMNHHHNQEEPLHLWQMNLQVFSSFHSFPFPSFPFLPSPISLTFPLGKTGAVGFMAMCNDLTEEPVIERISAGFFFFFFLFFSFSFFPSL